MSTTYISTVIQLSDVHSSHTYLSVLFHHNCYPIYSVFTDIVMHRWPCYCRLGTRTFLLYLCLYVFIYCTVPL